MSLRKLFYEQLGNGEHLVTVARRDGSQYLALVNIKSKSNVCLTKKPEQNDMYTATYKVDDDRIERVVSTFVYAFKNNPELMCKFEGVPVKLIAFPQK